MEIPEKVKPIMEVRLYVGNLSRSTTQDELSALFAQAGEVLSVEVIKNHKTTETKGFAFVTMSTQSGADQAAIMFNAYTFSGYTLRVSPARPREDHIEMILPTRA